MFRTQGIAIVANISFLLSQQQQEGFVWGQVFSFLVLVCNTYENDAKSGIQIEFACLTSFSFHTESAAESAAESADWPFFLTCPSVPFCLVPT